MPRLTNTMRDNLQERIMEATDFPDRRRAILQEFFIWCTAYAKSHLPTDFEAKTKNLPREWFRTECTFDTSGHYNPATIVGPKHQRYSHYQDSPFEAMAVPQSLCIPDPVEAYTLDNKQVIKIAPGLEPIIKKAEAWASEIEAVEVELRKTLAAYTSTEKLLKDFPQFAKHLTIPQKAYPVTVAPSKLSALLTATGFDKTEAA